MKIGIIIGMFLSQLAFSSVFDSFPFPSYLYPYQVESQSSTVASGNLERAEAAAGFNMIGLGPYYAVRWNRPYCSYMRTLYSKYNLGESSFSGMPWLNRYFANSDPLFSVSQFIYYDFQNFLAFEGADPFWYPSVGGPLLARMGLATDVTGLRGSPILTNLTWNSASQDQFEGGGATLIVSKSVDIPLGFTTNPITGTIPRAFTRFKLYNDLPSKNTPPDTTGTEPYPDSGVEDWWIPWIKWDYSTPSEPMADLNWAGGVSNVWNTWSSSNSADKWAYPTVELPSAHYEPIYGGGSSNYYPMDKPWYIYGVVDVGGLDRFRYSPCKFTAPAYTSFTNDNMASGVKIDWDVVPGVATHNLYIPGPSGLYAGVSLGNSGSYTLSGALTYNQEIPTAKPYQNPFGTIPNKTRNPDLGYSYGINLSGSQYIKYHTPPTVEYCARRTEWEPWIWPDPNVWDCEGFIGLALDQWVIYDEYLNITGFGPSGSNVAGQVDSWRTSSMTRQMKRFPTMSWGQEPVMDFYSRASSVSPWLECLGQNQSWTTVWELLNPVFNYPQTYEDLGVTDFTPPNTASIAWTVESVADTCEYDTNYVYKGSPIVQVSQPLCKTYIRGETTVTTNKNISDETVYVTNHTTPIPDASYSNTWVGSTFPFESWKWRVTLFTVETHGINGTKYRSTGTILTYGYTYYRQLVMWNNTNSTIGAYFEAEGGFPSTITHGYYEAPFPGNGLGVTAGGLNGLDLPDPPYPVLGAREYVVTNQYVNVITNCTDTLLTLEALAEPKTVEYFYLPDGFEYCEGNTKVWNYWSYASPYFSWTFPTIWTNDAHESNPVVTTNETYTLDGNDWAVWSNTYFSIELSGTIAEWKGTRYIPNGDEGILQENVNYGYADPEAYDVNVWNQDQNYELYNDYPDRSITGKAEYVDAQWDITLEYKHENRLLEYKYYDYFVDPRNVLKWDGPGGFKIK